MGSRGAGPRPRHWGHDDLGPGAVACRRGPPRRGVRRRCRRRRLPPRGRPGGGLLARGRPRGGADRADPAAVVAGPGRRHRRGQRRGEPHRRTRAARLGAVRARERRRGPGRRGDPASRRARPAPARRAGGLPPPGRGHPARRPDDRGGRLGQRLGHRHRLRRRDLVRGLPLPRGGDAGAGADRDDPDRERAARPARRAGPAGARPAVRHARRLRTAAAAAADVPAAAGPRLGRAAPRPEGRRVGAGRLQPGHHADDDAGLRPVRRQLRRPPARRRRRRRPHPGLPALRRPDVAAAGHRGRAAPRPAAPGERQRAALPPQLHRVAGRDAADAARGRPAGDLRPQRHRRHRPRPSGASGCSAAPWTRCWTPPSSWARSVAGCSPGASTGGRR